MRRAPLASGSGSPALPAGERWVSTLAAGQRLPEPTRGSFPRLCQIWRVSSGLESWRSCWAWVGKARIKFNRFEKPVFIPCPAVPVFVLSSFIHFIRVSKLKPTSFFMLLKLSSPAWSGHLRDVSEGTNRGETGALPRAISFGLPVPSRAMRSLVSLSFCRRHVMWKCLGAVRVTIIDVVIIRSKTLFLVCFLVFLKEMKNMQFLSICQSVYLVTCQAWLGNFHQYCGLTDHSLLYGIKRPHNIFAIIYNIW